MFVLGWCVGCVLVVTCCEFGVVLWVGFSGRWLFWCLCEYLYLKQLLHGVVCGGWVFGCWLLIV